MINLTLPENLAPYLAVILPSRQGQPNLLPCRRLYRRQGGGWFRGGGLMTEVGYSGNVETGRVTV